MIQSVRLLRFALVGVSATLLYAVLAILFDQLAGHIMSQSALSLAAFALSAVYSYCAHKFITFSSSGSYRIEVPRFTAVTATGASVSLILPVLAENWLELPMYVTVAAVCILIPMVNFVALNFWVFARR